EAAHADQQRLGRLALPVAQAEPQPPLVDREVQPPRPPVPARARAQGRETVLLEQVVDRLPALALDLRVGRADRRLVELDVLDPVGGGMLGHGCARLRTRGNRRQGKANCPMPRRICTLSTVAGGCQAWRTR